MNKIGYIYVIINNINGKIYIGQTGRDVKTRLGEHKRDLINNNHRNAHLQNSCNKYGIENFTFESLFEVPVDELDDIERYYIDVWDLQNPEKGYNKESGGNLNKKLSEETKRKMSKTTRECWKDEEYRKKMRKRDKKHSEKMRGKNHPMYGRRGEDNPNYGRKHTEEELQKMSENSKGQNNPRAKYNLWDILCVHYSKGHMFRYNREPNPCKCFIFKYNGYHLPIGLFHDFVTPEIINNFIKDVIVEV